jgi:hypothetical protein
MVFLWVQNKNDPKITKPALQCKPLAPAGPGWCYPITAAAAPNKCPGQITRNKTGQKFDPKKRAALPLVICWPMLSPSSWPLELQPIRNARKNILR